MTPSLKCKAAGLKSLNELAEISHQSPQTLSNWYKHKPELFEVVLAGSVVIKSEIKWVIKFLPKKPEATP